MRALLSYFISLLGKQIWKMSLLVICEILRLFVTILTADDKHPLWNCENLPLPIQMQLSKKRKTFSHFFFHFWNLHQIPNFSKKEDDRHS